MKLNIKKKILAFSTLLLLEITFNNTAKASNSYTEELTPTYAQYISQGYITLENGTVDTLLYGKSVLNPDADDDYDGLSNKNEIYIYNKNGKKYIGYYSHPRLYDTDGDGYNDKIDNYRKIWNITARDMAMFMELSYREDDYIYSVLNNNYSLTNLFQNRLEYKMMNNELAPFWKVKETYHYGDGFDAVLFETKSNYPYLADSTINVLAIRGTKDDTDDFISDSAIALGQNPKQVKSIEYILDSYARNGNIKNLYITGHSLGGYLAQRANIYAYQNGYTFVKKVYTFNAPKIKSGALNLGISSYMSNISKIGDMLSKYSRSIHYATNNDKVVAAAGGNFYNSIFVGNTQGGHSSRSYFEYSISQRNDFKVGYRSSMHSTGYKQKNLSYLSFPNY